MAWVCLLYDAPDFTILQPQHDELANRLTFTLLLATARKNTDLIARVLLSTKAPEAGGPSNESGMFKGDFTSVPTSFDILGEILEHSSSRF
ncbi:hypothetical protein J1614_005160 [Plenodomus biglobosus]|nr:hypothetical protein J1614_005160 [Plenodomus biglobosus]